MYLIKLKIEMNMADLIVKIVRASSPPQGHELHRYAVSYPPSPPGRPVAGSRRSSDRSKKTAVSDGSQTAIVRPPSAEQQPSNRTPTTQAWELTRMPSSFSAEDIVDQRKVSVAEGAVLGDDVVPGFAPIRPALTRNMSEMTELEIGVGYLNNSCKEKKMCVEHSPC